MIAKKYDRQIGEFFDKYNLLFLRWSLGIVFLWFGFLKFFPGVSPAEELAGKTINHLSMGMVDPRTANFVLAIWESAIGLGFLTGKYLRETIILMFLQMAGTFTPLLFYPEETFKVVPFVATLEGQYIIKNIVLLAAASAVGARTFNKK